MSTRYAHGDAPVKSNRYASCPEFAEARGISGTAVCAKASLLASAQKRSLLYWLQAMSLAEGGLKFFAQKFLAAYPERLGTATMHKSELKSREVYSAESSRNIGWELDGSGGDFSVEGILDEPRSQIEPARERLSVEHCLKECRSQARNLPAFLEELCVNPRIEFCAPGEDDELLELERERAAEIVVRDQTGCWERASVNYFHDVVGALFDYQNRRRQEIRSRFAFTSIADAVFNGLDYCLKMRRMVVVDGREGLGKTEAAQAWCRMHPGEARFVSLSGITQKTSFFRAIARSLGVANGHSYSTTDVQARVEDFLQRSRLCLVVDEAHFLFPQSARMHSRPELIDWVNTALCNHGIPVGLVCTPQLKARMIQAERQVGWNAGQFRRRVGQYVDLPDKVTEDDLELVAKTMLPEASESAIDLLVGYALPNWQPMSSLALLIEDSRRVAHDDGRDKVQFKDVVKAKAFYRDPTDLALAKANIAAKPGKVRSGLANSVPAQSHLNGRATRLQTPDLSARESGPTTETSGSRIGSVDELTPAV